MVTFGREKSFLDFYLVYNRFRFKILRPIQQMLEMVFLDSYNYISCMFKSLNEKIFEYNLCVNVPLNILNHYYT